jgi:molybdopterin-binding protein
MKISARNQLKGTIVDVVKGATTSHVRIDIGGGVTVTASITNEAVDDLVKGKPAIAEGPVQQILTRERLEALYGAPVNMIADATGTAFIPG